MNKGIFELNSEQEKAFKKLEKAYKECEKLGIYFVNHYGSLLAFDKKYIKKYADDSSLNPDADNVISMLGESGAYNYFSIPNEWCDDGHLIELTSAGLKLYNSEDE